MITINTKYQCNVGEGFHEYSCNFKKNNAAVFYLYIYSEYQNFKKCKMHELYCTLETNKRSILFAFIREERRLKLSINGTKCTARTIQQTILEYCRNFQKFVEQDKEGGKNEKEI